MSQQLSSLQRPSAPTSAPAAATRISREQREKESLKKRKEGFTRYDSTIDEPLKVVPASAGVYLSDRDRFHTDVAGEERRSRNAAALAQQSRLVQRRDDALARDQKRWEAMGEATKAEDARMDRKRVQGLAAKKNAPSLPFNPITLEYATNYDGGLLQHQDDMVKYRSALRTQNLYTRQNGDYNPITGASRRDVEPPTKPQTPAR